MTDERETIDDIDADNQREPANDPAYEKKLTSAEIDAAEAKFFWAQVLGHPIGRREIWRLLEAMHPFETKFACGPNGFPQKEASWHALGEQQLGLRFYHSLLQLDRAGTLLMQDEHDPRFAKPEKPKRQRVKS